jgi:hypothetical protein
MKSERNAFSVVPIFLNQIFYIFSINALHEVMKEQTEQLKILKDKCLHLASQIDSHAELQAEVDKNK